METKKTYIIESKPIARDGIVYTAGKEIQLTEAEFKNYTENTDHAQRIPMKLKEEATKTKDGK